MPSETPVENMGSMKQAESPTHTKRGPKGRVNRASAWFYLALRVRPGAIAVLDGVRQEDVAARGDDLRRDAMETIMADDRAKITNGPNERAVNETIDRIYRRTEEITDFARELEQENAELRKALQAPASAVRVARSAAGD